MRICFLVTLICCCLPVTVQAEIFKWVDERGNVHYGDAPPASAATETITPQTDKLGVQLSKPASTEQWKQDALERQPVPPATSSGTVATQHNTRRNDSTDYQQQDWCEGVVGNCFSAAQDEVCKLRYGDDCQTLYHWKVCLHQSCTDNRLVDKCDSAFYFLDHRPVMLGRRDLGRPLPIQAWVSARDWECLSTHGFFCDEVAFENQCQEQYRLSCDELKNWVSSARERCIQSRDGDCNEIDTLVRYRPAPLEEVKKAGTMNAKGTVITQDLLLQSLGVHKQDPQDESKLRPVLDSMTGLNISDTRKSFDCERRWQD